MHFLYCSTLVDDRDDAGGSVMRLDSKEMSIYGVCPETDRFTAVVCDYCGTVVKPQSFKSHIKRHASDPSAATALQAVWADAKNWTDNHPDTLTSGVEDVSLDKKLKPPSTNKCPKNTTASAFLDELEARDPGSLFSFRGQKWTTFLKNADQLQNSDRQGKIFKNIWTQYFTLQNQILSHYFYLLYKSFRTLY